MSDTVESWKKRVANWRASGQTAREFSEGKPWSPKTLQWWSSRLGREPMAARPAAPVVRVAQLVRAPTAEHARGAVVIEVLDARLRITVEAGATAETVAAVLQLLVRAEAS